MTLDAETLCARLPAALRTTPHRTALIARFLDRLPPLLGDLAGAPATLETLIAAQRRIWGEIAGCADPDRQTATGQWLDPLDWALAQGDLARTAPAFARYWTARSWLEPGDLERLGAEGGTLADLLARHPAAFLAPVFGRPTPDG